MVEAVEVAVDVDAHRGLTDKLRHLNFLEEQSSVHKKVVGVFFLHVSVFGPAHVKVAKFVKNVILVRAVRSVRVLRPVMSVSFVRKQLGQVHSLQNPLDPVSCLQLLTHAGDGESHLFQS
jgi:hypothetical protein